MFGRLTTPVETRHAVFTEFSGSRAGQQSSQLMQGMGELGYPNCWNYLEVKCADHSVTIYQDRIKRKRWNNLPCKLILSDRRWTRLSLLRKKKKKHQKLLSPSKRRPNLTLIYCALPGYL